VEQLETRLTPSAVLATLASLSSSTGGVPGAGLIMDGSGNLYGTTTNGEGGPTDGTVFELAHGSDTPVPLAPFNGINGSQPSGSVIMDGSGNLYGSTFRGGAANDGTVFEVAHGSGTITTLASFNGTDGQNPTGALVLDGSGNLYGVTPYGGASGDGTVFEVAHGSGTITTLASFNGTDGKGPRGGLVMDGSGHLYGTAQGGGAHDLGTVFELAPGSGTFTTLASLTVLSGGPNEPLLMDGGGNLYGTTAALFLPPAGFVAYGTVFELAHGSGTVSTLATFNGTDGVNSDGPLVMDRNGNLYGTATANGAGVGYSGTIFELPNGSGTINTLATFNGSNGTTAVGGLTMDSNSNLYGVTTTGGTFNDGTIFELPVSGIALLPQSLPAATVGAGYSQTLSTIGGAAPYTFAVTAGALPAGLTLSPAGVLSGTPTAPGPATYTSTATDSTGATGSQVYTVTAYPATFGVTGFPSSTTADVAGTVTALALDANGNVLPGYTGTVHFSSSDLQAALPADYTFTAADQGVHTFSAMLKTAGSQSITTTDTANGSATGSDLGITVTPAATAALAFSSVPGSTTAGSPFTVTLTARDAYGNTTPGYTRTVRFASSDAQAVLPANYTFTSADAGQHSFAITLKTSGTHSVTAADAVTSSITGTAQGIAVKAAAAARFVLTAPSSATHGVAFSVTLTVYDAYGNVATGYTGTVHFSSSDGTASLPANYTFTAADAGVHTFAVVLRKKGKQTLTVADTANGTLTATDTISVG
jgi:uncharacterized repeat protein (TIGR03803 family)